MYLGAGMLPNTNEWWRGKAFLGFTFPKYFYKWCCLKPRWKRGQWWRRGEAKQNFYHRLWSTGKCKQCQLQIEKKMHLLLFRQPSLPLTEEIDWTDDVQMVLADDPCWKALKKKAEVSGILFWKKSLFCPAGSSWINLPYSGKGDSRRTHSCALTPLFMMPALSFSFVLCWFYKRNNIVSGFKIHTALPGARWSTERNFEKEL